MVLIPFFLISRVFSTVLVGIGNLNFSLWSKEGYELLVLPGKYLHFLPVYNALSSQLLDVGSEGLYLSI